MFGGLAVKGGDANDDSSSSAPPAAAASSSSGFSFLQTATGAAAPTASSEQPAVEGEQQSSMSMGTSGGSAFGFLSGGSTTETNNNADSNTNNNSAPPSMFAGLNNTPAATNNSESQGGSIEAPPPQHSSSGSGFSFMSSLATSATTPAESNNNSVEAASNVSTAGSSFGFMSSMMSTTDENGEQTEAGEIKEESSAAPASSGFSFLSSGSISNTAPPPPADDMASHSPSLIPQSEPSSQGSSSMFAGLNTSATTETKNTENSDVTTAPPPPPADSDLLSMSSPALPAASGVSWGAPPGVGGGKKIVKKKRGKRVGVGSAAAAVQPQQPPPVQQQQQPMATESSIPAPEPSSFQPPPPLSTDSYAQPAPSNNPPVPMYQPSPMASEIKTADEEPPPKMSPPMRVKAEMAMQNAEEFIKEKQRSAIAMAAERAMNEKVTSENGSGTGGGGWKLGAAEQQLSPKDSEYQAAKAAAEEARNFSATKGKASLFSGSLVSGVSGFFGRKSPNTSSTTDPASIASYSSHGGVVNNTLDPVRRTNSASSATSLSPTKEGGEEHQSTDPIQRENEEAKRAAAERDMAAFRENQMQEQERLAEAKRAEEKKQLEQERLRQLEEQAKRRSPKEKMQAALDHFADVTRTSTDYVTQLRAKRAELVKERMEAEKDERFAAQQISHAEAQQTQAAEDEDFEAADRLASDIERHTLEKNKQTAIVKSIAESISQIEKQRDAACKAVVACFSDVNSKLKELQADVDDREKQDGVLNQFANTSKRLSSETERLSNDLKHIERDESVLADEQKELESQITEQTKEFEENRVEASEKLEVVNQEIEELRKKLAEAEEKAATLNNELSSYNGSIQSVRSKYSRQLGRLEKKERSVKESRAEWQVEHESVEKAKVAHESVVAAHSEEMLTREKIIEEIKVEVSVAHDFEDIVTSAFDATEFIGDDNQAFDSDVLKYEAAVDEANNNVISAESTIQSLQEELSTFDVRVPILEAEKKVAAAKRDFKAAGKASKEIKDALARKEQCEAELSGEATERKQAAKEELQKVTLLLEEKKSIAAEKGKEASLKRIETLRERIAHLQSVVKELGVDPTDSDSINVACVGAFVIDSQISVLEAEGKALGEKYGGWETDAVEDSSNAADEANDVGGVPSDTVIDDDTLQEYATLAAEIEELEAKIDQAAAEEDYDTATELEEKADSLRSKINSLGHSPEQMAQALKDRATNSSENESPSNILDESILGKYASLRAQVEQLEADIETAVATDNFDDAAELEEKVQVAKTEIESLGFSVDDLEEALQNGLTIDDDEAEPDTEAIDETAEDVSQSPSGDVDVIEEEANDTKENETPNGTDTINDEANENDAKVAQTASESDDAQVIED
eukprot:scaffold212_cov108-Skeletonema_dohrnii-CCMP3373.AAC.9